MKPDCPGQAPVWYTFQHPNLICVIDMLDRINVNPNVCAGRPTIRGLRITVDFVLKLLGGGYAAPDIIGLYPELETEDVLQAARYGAWLASERTLVLA